MDRPLSPREIVIPPLLDTAEPTAGIHLLVPDRVYHHSLFSLSSSQARRLWWSGITPRQARHEQLFGSPDTDTFEFGRAVHTETFGFGPPVVRLEFRDWKTNRAQELRRAHRAAGHIPLLPRTYDKAVAMAAAVRDHPALVPLLTTGWPEVSFYWPDPATGLMLRARPDWLHPADDGGVIVVDLKTTDSADPEDFAWSVLRYGYHLQQNWYSTAITTFRLAVRRFLFAAVSKHPPHVVSVCELDPDDVLAAGGENRRAIDLYARCLASDTWPDHGPGIHRIHLPRRANLRYRH
ncbi:PD-(D/E)XK nuclease-like domain-containing protein [Nocardia sp. NPDC050710]|uniref:PD-(D/E)XK nuclease-like domain-containing protein n=1 Tax=Nocardia sp. NPDC050710 TaxID=3157220 RepID=UPI0033ED45FD